MNQWTIKTEDKREFNLIQTGLAFKMAKKGETAINPYFCDSDIAKALFNDDSEFLTTLGSMKLTTEKGIKITINAL